jgi:N-acetylmuramoyl-L-alanine amidase
MQIIMNKYENYGGSGGYMKNIFKTLLTLILAFALCIPMQIIAKASTYTDIGAKNNVIVSKPWTVSFNKSLSSTTVNNTNIKVVGEANNYIDIAVSLANNNKNVIVTPLKDYKPSTSYTLIVTQNVKSSDGKPLPKEVRMNFNTESAATKPSEFTVCIDPAQYYKNITGKSGTKAKDINLSTALKLGNILKTRGFNVVYTRTTDSVPWSMSGEDDAKAAIAKNAKADVFLSINTNNSSNMEASGIETYYIPDGSNNLIASSIQSELIKATQANDRLIKIAPETASFEILKKTSCPAVMMELGFLSNPEEELLLTNEKYQNNAAKAIANGLMNYAGFPNTDKNYDVITRASNAYKVVLDPGHGGTDSGAVGAMGTKEKTIVLAITLKVGNILAKNGVDVVYTREIDKTQSLQAKCDVSNIAKPNYFVSIHANSFSVPTVSGIETFYKSGSAAGQKLAEAVQTELLKATGRVDRKIKTAGYYVLNNTNTTAILVETSFLSNATEEKLLVTTAYQIKLAQAISTGILKSLGITAIVL